MNQLFTYSTTSSSHPLAESHTIAAEPRRCDTRRHTPNTTASQTILNS